MLYVNLNPESLLKLKKVILVLVIIILGLSLSEISYAKNNGSLTTTSISNESEHGDYVLVNFDDLSEPEIYCLALTVYFESRGESLMGQYAVAQVVRNRVRSDMYPNTYCEVMKQKSQFSFYWDGEPEHIVNDNSWNQSMSVAYNIMNNWLTVDCVGDSLWYHAEYVSPKWRKSFNKTCKIGQHIFYRKGE